MVCPLKCRFHRTIRKFVAAVVSLAVVVSFAPVLAAGPAVGAAGTPAAAHHAAPGDAVHHHADAFQQTAAIDGIIAVDHRDHAGARHHGDSAKPGGKSNACCDTACHVAMLSKTDVPLVQSGEAHADAHALSLCLAQQMRLDRPPRPFAI